MTQPRRHQTREIDSDLHTFEQTLLRHTSDGMNSAITLASNIAEYCDGDEEMGAETQELMKEFIQMEAQIKQHIEALKHVKSVAASLDEDATLKSEFDQKINQIHKPLKVTSHPKYTTMMKELEKTCNNNDEEFEALRSRLLGETDDDEVAMTETEVNIRCPYTGQNMTEPVKNTVCGHVYDKDGIMGHIQAKKKKAKCPVGGCVNPHAITLDQLEDFQEMRRYIQLLNRQNQ